MTTRKIKYSDKIEVAPAGKRYYEDGRDDPFPDEIDVRWNVYEHTNTFQGTRLIRIARYKKVREYDVSS